MIGLIHYEWEKLFRGRVMGLHGSLYLFTVSALLYFSRVFDDDKTIVLARSMYAKSFMASANDVIYLSAMVYAVFLSSRLFIPHGSDRLTVQLLNRRTLVIAKWGLGAFIILSYTLAAWLIAYALLNGLSDGAIPLLSLKTIALGMIHALQAFTLFALLAGFFRASHTFLFVLAAVFLIDTLRSGLYRPDGLNHGQYLSHAILPSLTQVSDGSLIIMASPWLVFTLHGLFLLMVFVLNLFKEY